MPAQNARAGDGCRPPALSESRRGPAGAHRPGRSGCARAPRSSARWPGLTAPRWRAPWPRRAPLHAGHLSVKPPVLILHLAETSAGVLGDAPACQPSCSMNLGCTQCRCSTHPVGPYKQRRDDAPLSAQMRTATAARHSCLLKAHMATLACGQSRRQAYSLGLHDGFYACCAGRAAQGGSSAPVHAAQQGRTPAKL